ncbi:unnamed protein product, partial [Meganyctiphanes norvegica]
FVWGWFIGFRLICGVLSLTLIGDLSDIARVTIDGVGDLLQAAVREGHIVGTLSVVAITGFIVTKVIARVVILDSVIEVILGRLLIGWGRSISRLAGGSQGHSHKGEGE